MSQGHTKPMPVWLTDKLSALDIGCYQAECKPQRFEDSTHDVWRLYSKQGRYFLKVCSNTHSPFWQIMQQLFGVNLQADIQYFDMLYRHIAKLTPLQIPKLIKAESIPQHGAYILTTEAIGSLPDNACISREMLEQLAEHLAMLHNDQYKMWGSMHQPLLAADEWQQRLGDTLEKSAHKWGGGKTDYQRYLDTALEACYHLEVEKFVPMMPDLRWDQFLLSKDNNNAVLTLLDLDAFVIAPRELDFILLEYLLDQQQAEYFTAIYTRHHDIPDLSYARSAYRLLLFFMEVLGEQAIEQWMMADCYF